MTTYEVIKDEDGLETIKRTNADGSISFIPTDSTNSDYQRYLNPEAEQSTPSVMENLTEDQ
jgi:hypothetical protein